MTISDDRPLYFAYRALRRAWSRNHSRWRSAPLTVLLLGRATRELAAAAAPSWEPMTAAEIHARNNQRVLELMHFPVSSGETSMTQDEFLTWYSANVDPLSKP